MGAGLSRSGGAQLGSMMDEEWGMSSGSEYASSEMGSSTEDTVSMVDESCETVRGSSSEGDDVEGIHVDNAEGSGKGKSRKRKREPTELTAALVKAWVPWRKAFRLAGRLMAFSVYDVALFTGLPVTDKIVEFDEDDLSTTELARIVCLCMGQYVTEKSDNLKSEKGRKRPVFRNYIKVMKKLLDANKELEKLGLWLSLYAWRVMSWVMFPITPYGAAWFPRLASWDSVDHGERYDAFQLVEGIRESKVILVFHPWEEEMLVPTGALSYEERLERAREELRAEKGKHVNTLRMLRKARLKMCAAPGEAQDTGHSPGGDVGKDVQSDSGLESLARAVTDLGEATTHEFSAVKGGEEDTTCQITTDIPGASCDAQSKPPRMVDAAALVDDCDGVWDAPQCRKLLLVHRSPYGNSSSPVIRESGAPPGPHIGEEAANIDAQGPGVDEVYVGGDSAAGESVYTTPASLADDGGGKSSNIVTCMRRKPRCWKPATVHGSPFTDPTSQSGARKSKKERKEGMTGADEPRAADDPGEGSVHPSVFDLQPISVERSGIGPSVEELNKLKLTKLGGGPLGVSAETRAYKLVTGPHPCGSKGRSQGQDLLLSVGVHAPARDK
ncbi:hypothetical protein Cgig2_030878 [Carnegiea gigantea]|uniref:Uncharacterized protein n=1 Tax=Carnegiea gigantea TaxID=171969 RepID=A0A9Q1KHM1_9CARY|nr:hypothetical protein Cgig2_030878 [Carnegiea gigantea]